jgi:hypothetical protein
VTDTETIYLVHSCLPLSTADDFVSFIVSIIVMLNVILIMIQAGELSTCAFNLILNTVETVNLSTNVRTQTMN